MLNPTTRSCKKYQLRRNDSEEEEKEESISYRYASKNLQLDPNNQVKRRKK
jgi:hypothetical protein